LTSSQLHQRDDETTGSLLRDYFSSDATTAPPTTTTTTTPSFGFSTSSLGLEHCLIRPVMSTIMQLPEVNASHSSFPSASALDHLQRASDVFGSITGCRREHVAVRAMTAECQQRLAMYEESLRTLDDDLFQRHLSQPVDDDAAAAAAAAATGTMTPNFVHDTMILATAKVRWLNGQFSESERLCDSILRTYDDLNERYPNTTTNLHLASAMTGKALSQLASMATLEDAYSVRDYFRVAVNFLDRHPTRDGNALPHAAALSNLGTAEWIYGTYLEETNGNGISVPMDGALRSWFRGLQKVVPRGPRGDGNSHNHHNGVAVAASKMLEGTIQANLAWGVLNYEVDRSDRLSKASDYAKKALAVYDDDDDDDDDDGADSNHHHHHALGKEGLPRVLTVTATCYQHADNAVTAEGLFQSAIADGGGRRKAARGGDSMQQGQPLGTLATLELREAYLRYADLCTQWDRREGDARKHLEKAAALDGTLPPGWRGKSGIHGSLWFWTPGDFL
jgi:hypothetical protein